MCIRDRQLTGGGRQGGNRGSANPEQEKPYATIGVDTASNLLLVTGPEHIYLRVKKLVEKIDREIITETKTVGVDGIPNLELIEYLKLLYGDMIITTDELEEGTTPAAAGGGGARATGGASRATPAAPNAAALQNIIRQAQGGRGGGRGGGGNRRGGGGGGNRGGARGGR